ncbi:MAG: lipopolysaccharide biosynthesis protein [Pygmaiobacter sp.]
MTKNAVCNTVGTFIYFFFQWLTTILVVRLGDFESAGLFSLAISFCNLFGFISRYGIRNFQVTDVDRIFSDGQYLGHRILTTVISLLPFFVLMLYRYGRQPYFMGCILCYMLFKYLESVTDLLFGVMQRAERYDWILTSYFAKGFLPVAVFAGLLWAKSGLLFAIIGMAIIYFAVVVIFDLPHLQTVTKLKPSFKGLKPLFVQCFPLMLFSLVTPYMTYLTRSVVEQRFGPTELGYYSSVSVVVVIMTTIGGSIWCVLIPRIRKWYNQGQVAQIKKLLGEVLLATLMVGFLAVVAAKFCGAWALVLVFDEPIRAYAGLLSPVLVASILLTVSALFSSILTALKHNLNMLLINICGAVVCTATAGVFVDKWGMYGANASLIVALAVQIVCMTGLIVSTLHNIPDGPKEITDETT